MAGNFTDIPKMDAYRLPPVWNEDNIFPLIPDPRGHATDRKAPGGWIANTDSLGQRWELTGAGFGIHSTWRSTKQEACFADSDMEWDWDALVQAHAGAAHITSSSEFGWHTGSHQLVAGFRR